MYCSKCGKEINENSNYCKHCGYKINVIQDIEDKTNNEITSPKSNTNVKVKNIVYTLLLIIIGIGIAIFVIHDKEVENYRS